MSGIAWKKEYEVGIPAIDEQHQNLVEMIRRLQDSLDEGNELSGPIVGQTLKELVEYTQVHFHFEEEYMARMKYSGLDDHKKHHRHLLGEIRATLLKLREGEELTTIEMIEFLKHWLVDHILREDKKIGRELHRKITLAKGGV